MNKFANKFSLKIYFTPVLRIIFFCGFIPSLLFILLYQFYFIEIPGSPFAFKIGVILFSISSSILAACVFYFIAQYLPFDLPKERKKIKTLSVLNQYFISIDEVVQQIVIDINFENQNIKDFTLLENHLESIDVNSKIYDFENWFKYFYHKKQQLLDLTRSSFYFNDFINPEIALELLILDKRLMDLHLFSGYKILTNDKLSFAALALQEIFIHNSHLQELRKIEMQKYELVLSEIGKSYRDRFYS